MDILIFPVIVIFLVIFIVAVSSTSKNAGLDRSRRRPHGHVWPAHHDAGSTIHQFQDTSGWEQQQHHQHDAGISGSDSGFGSDSGSGGDCGCGGGGDSGGSGGGGGGGSD